MIKDIYLKEHVANHYEYDYGIAELYYPLAPFVKDYLANIEMLGYSYPESTNYRNAVVRWFSMLYGSFPEGANITYTGSIKYALKKTFELTPKEEVVILNFIPCYNGFNDVFANNYKVCDFEWERLFSPGYEAELEDFIARNKITHLLISNPHNPTGKVLSAEQLAVFARLCAKYDIIFMCDEAHAEFVDGEFFSALYLDHPKTVIYRSIGKPFNVSGIGGGYFLVRDLELGNRLQEEIVKDGFHAPSCLGYGVTTICYSEEGKAWLDGNLETIFANKKYFEQEIAHRTKGTMSASWQKGTYLSWLDYSKLAVSEETMREQCELQKIKVMFGSDYNLPLPYLRLNLACDRDKVEILLKRLTNIYNNLKKD